MLPLSALPFQSVADYDRPFFAAGRPTFVKGWIAQAQSCALGIVENNRLAGYGVIRRCRNGCKIGPLLADTPDLADGLFVALSAHATRDEPIYLDVPQPNTGAIELAERHGMTPVFETARMFTKGAPAIPIDRLYGITSFEVG